MTITQYSFDPADYAMMEKASVVTAHADGTIIRSAVSGR